MLAGEHLARAAEAGLHFVEDQEDVVLVADLSDCVKVARWRRDIAAFTEDRLDDDGGCV